MQAKTKPVIVIYGGTFNPIHNGHILPVIDSAKFINAEKLIYLPCHLPPHKQTPSVTSFHRLEMVKLALANQKDLPFEVIVSDYEIQSADQNQTPSYTRLSIEYFHQLYPNHDLYFLIGMDSLLNFHTWFKWQEIFNFCNLLIMRRPNVELNLSTLNNQVTPYLNNKIVFTETTEVDISSSQIKALLTQNYTQQDNAFSHVPSPVVEYINAHNLYK